MLGRSLAFAERGGRFEEHLDLALLTVDDRARAGNGKSARIDLRLTPDEVDRVRVTGVRWLAQLDLAPGHYQVRVAGRAVGTGASGTLTYDVDVPAFAPERLAMSGVTMTSLPSVLMVTRGDPWLQTTLETPPIGSEELRGWRRIRAGVEVYVPALLQADVEIAAQVERPDGLRIALRSQAHCAWRWEGAYGSHRVSGRHVAARARTVRSPYRSRLSGGSGPDRETSAVRGRENESSVLASALSLDPCRRVAGVGLGGLRDRTVSSHLVAICRGMRRSGCSIIGGCP